MAAVNERIGQSLENLLASELTLQWAEAVALIQGTCRQLIATGAAGFPAASQIVLYAEGTVVALTTTKQQPVEAAAHLLASMLTDDVPLRLRLIVSQAVTSDGGYATLPEFSEALAYFERPDSQTTLSALYQRAVLASPRQGVAPVPAVPITLAAPPRRPAAAARTRTNGWAIGATVAAGVLCLSVLFLGARAGGATADITAAPDGSPPPSSPAIAAATAPVAAKAAAVVAAPAAMRAAAAVRTTAFEELPILHTQGWNIPPLLPSIGAFAEPRPVGLVAHVSPRSVPARTTDSIYSSGDADVVPPASLYPKLPPAGPNGPGPGRTVLELLISADGLVEHVRLRTAPRDVHEFMLVSAAKTWRFEPATVHGRPVRFRHSIALTSSDKD